MTASPTTLCPHLAAAVLPRRQENRSCKSWEGLPVTIRLLSQKGGVLQQLAPVSGHG